MSRFISVCLCAVVAFVATCGASLLYPSAALAASGTVTMETGLHQDPDHGAPLVALLPEGTVVSIDGPPIDGFYPVTTGNLTGWMRGETLSLQKDIVDEAAAADAEATPDGAQTDLPVEQEAVDPSLLPQDAAADPAAAPSDPAGAVPVETVPVDPAANTAPVETVADDAAPPASEPAADTGNREPTDAPAAMPVTVDPSLAAAPEGTDPATDAGVTDPETMETAPPDPAAADTVPADPALESTEPAAAPESEPAPTADPNVTPIPVAVAGPEGPANAASELPILLGPGPDYGLISTAPRGSTIEQTGHVIDGYVSVQFADITGWAAIDQLVAPGTVLPEPTSDTTVADEPRRDRRADETVTPEVPTETPEAAPTEITPVVEPRETPVPTPTPVPVGPASVVGDTPIYSGPGTDYGLVFTVPQGSTLEQTGQIDNGFISVRYKEVIGWAAAELLTEPIEFVEETLPEETAEAVDTKTPRPGSGVAYTTADLSLRAGPSAEEEPVIVVPAGSRVVLTGVMEGNFQRVTFHDELGWIANEYLATPEDPAPNDEANAKKHYSERQVMRFIYEAADRYDQSRKDMLRVAKCESNLDPYAVNPSGSYGLFQFIRSTWKSTPYGDEDIFDPRANANAAAWMWSEGRKSEWVCQ